MKDGNWTAGKSFWRPRMISHFSKGVSVGLGPVEKPPRRVYTHTCNSHTYTQLSLTHRTLSLSLSLSHTHTRTELFHTHTIHSHTHITCSHTKLTHTQLIHTHTQLYGIWPHGHAFCVAGVALMALGWLCWRAWVPLRLFVWQACN